MPRVSKEYDYLVTLKKNFDNGKINLISQLLLVIACCLLAYYGIRIFDFQKRAAILAFIITLFIAGWLFLCFFSKYAHYYRLALLAAGVGFIFLLPHGWFGLLYIGLGLLEKQVKFPQEIGFDDEGVIINSLPTKTYAWSELKNVVINGKLLTIDFKSNKLLQKEIANPVSKDMENEFNEFCKKQLSK